MLGAHLDYLILRGLAHRRNLQTERERDRQAASVSAQDFEARLPKLAKLFARFEGRLPLDPALSYLDMGCGSGELTLALARLGVQRITGVDFVPRSIERAQAHALRMGLEQRANFLLRDLRTWQPPERFDVLLSFDMLEHVDAPDAFLRRMAHFATPRGIAVLAFGPLFHSPFGDHMNEFFRLPLPWRGLIFGERALLRVRREYYRPTDPAERLRDVVGGLNQMRYSEFLRYAREAGWTFDWLAVNTFLPAPLRAVSDQLTRAAPLGDYFVHNVYAVLRRDGLRGAG